MLLASHGNKAEARSVPDELPTLTRLEAERGRILAQLAGLRRGFQETVDAFAADECAQRARAGPKGSAASRAFRTWMVVGWASCLTVD
jgi:hypothetical protein